MQEVGKLANFTESRSHFAAWAVLSSPLILSFKLTDTHTLDAMWPIITNRRVIAVNQRWAGHPGTRLATDAHTGGEEWQAWAKPLGGGAHAALLLSTGSRSRQTISVPFTTISGDFARPHVAACVYDLHADPRQPPLGPILSAGSKSLTAAGVGAHDSAMYCVHVVAVEGHGGCPASCVG